jgi:lipopolysaccharide transport system permease protein
MHSEIAQIEMTRVGGASPRRVTTILPPALTLGGMARDLGNLIRYRDLLYTLTMHRIRVRYKQSVLGAAWAVVQPLSLMLIYTVIFSLIVRMPSDGTPYAVFAYSALLPWTFFATALGNSTNALVAHTQLITKVYFPREILPITYILASFVDFVVASLVFLGLMIYYGLSLSFAAFYAIPITIILMCFSTGVALALSATQVRFRDVGVAVPLLLQLWMFATPVVYPLSAVPNRFRRIYLLNPMAGLIDGFREVTVHANPPNLRLLGAAAAISLVCLMSGWIYFKRIEATIADVI